MDGSTEYIWWIKVTIAASNKVSAIWSILKMVTGNGYHPKKRTTCHCYVHVFIPLEVNNYSKADVCCY